MRAASTGGWFVARQARLHGQPASTHNCKLTQVSSTPLITHSKSVPPTHPLLQARYPSPPPCRCSVPFCLLCWKPVPINEGGITSESSYHSGVGLYKARIGFLCTMAVCAGRSQSFTQRGEAACGGVSADPTPPSPRRGPIPTLSIGVERPWMMEFRFGRPWRRNSWSTLLCSTFTPPSGLSLRTLCLQLRNPQQVVGSTREHE